MHNVFDTAGAGILLIDLKVGWVENGKIKRLLRLRRVRPEGCLRQLFRHCLHKILLAYLKRQGDSPLLQPVTSVGQCKRTERAQDRVKLIGHNGERGNSQLKRYLTERAD